MTSFSVCSIGEKPAVKFHHEYGEFDFYIVSDPKDPKKLAYAATARLTKETGEKILTEATEKLMEFAVICGYSDDASLGMYDLIKILGKAQKFCKD